jgi:hypothetical protein
MSNTQLTPGTIAYSVDDQSQTCTTIQFVSRSCGELEPFTHGTQEQTCVINACANPSFGLDAPGTIDKECTNQTYPAYLQFDPQSVKMSCPSGYTKQ